MALRHFALTMSGAAQRLSVVLADGLALQNGGKDDIAYGQLTFELSSGTKVFIGGDATVSSILYAGSCTTTKTYELLGATRLGDLWVIGTAADVLQIGAVPL